ncbi:MAG: Rho termination factor N-terminal domain-containing protein, partial [Pseudomonadota bacterium]
MNLTELKQRTATDLLEIARELGVENVSRARKQDVIFAILKSQA